jgi:hypothetical protein
MLGSMARPAPHLPAFNRKTVVSWCLYDFANSFYVVLPAVIWQVYYKREIVGNGGALIEEHAPARHVDVTYVREQHRDVLLAAQHPPDRRCDVARRQRRRSDLIQQRLEQMVIVAVEERDTDRGIGERPRRVETAEAAAEDDDVDPIVHASRFSVLSSCSRSVLGSGVHGSKFGVRCYRNRHAARFFA